MNNILQHPDRVYEYTRLYASSVASIISWGFRAKDFESFFYKEFYNFVEEARQAFQHCAIDTSGADL
jgi:hypothetical protein